MKVLRECLDLWLYIRQRYVNGSKTAVFDIKADYYSGKVAPKHFCPCCEYMVKRIGEFDDSKCKDYCPLYELWPNGCESSESPYWQVVTFEGNIIEHCDKIIEECRRLLND